MTSMSAYRYRHLDVFTDTPFAGNQLAVLTDARGLSDAQMQSIAREMNFSETTFVLPAEAAGTDARVRIFTPGMELPMAGHPTIGTTFALAHEGVIGPGADAAVLGLNIGPTRVELEWDGSRLRFAWMDQRPPTFAESPGPVFDIARAIGLEESAIDGPVEVGSSGVPVALIPLRSRRAVDSAEADPSAMRRLAAAGGQQVCFYLFTRQTGEPDVTTYSRMFAPGLGVTEDPATGSAGGPLGAYLIRHGLVATQRAHEMLNLQGVAMGRPSRIHIRIAAGADGTIQRVQVGGTAVRVAEGTLDIGGA
jgi:trans-2,3-dihydro-3-hydroxyanthranilate isomerase